jgi:RHS repeat-associated protein
MRARSFFIGKLVTSFWLLLLLTIGTSMVPTEAKALEGWCVAVHGSASDCFNDPQEACNDAYNVWAGNGTFGGYQDTDKWYVKMCVWSPYPGPVPGPGQTRFFCPSDGNQYAYTPPNRCSLLADNLPASNSCICGAAKQDTPRPINILSGSKRFEVTDFETADGSLRLHRIYQSLPYGSNAVGYMTGVPLGMADWFFDFQYELQIGYDWTYYQRVVLVTPQGASYSFARQSDGTMTPYVNSGWPQTQFTLALNGTWPSNLSTLATAKSKWILTDPDGAVWNIETFLNPATNEYEIARPVKKTTRNGLVWNFSYGSHYELTSITDSYGKSVSFSWLLADPSVVGASGNVVARAIDTVTLPTGDTLKYTYATFGGGTPTLPAPDILTSVQYKDSLSVVQDSVTYAYGNSSFPASITGIYDKNSVERWFVTYDSSGRATSSAGPSSDDNYSVSYTAGGTSFTRTVTNPLGKIVTYNYTNAYPWTKPKLTGTSGSASTYTPSSTTSISYGSDNFISSTTDEEGRVTNDTRNSRGLPTQTVEGYGTSAARTTNYTWHSTLPVPTEIQQPNLTTDFTYNTAGQLTSLTQTDTTTTSTPYSTNGQTRTWAYTWSSTGQLLTVDGPLSGTGDTVTYTYNANGYLATVTNELSQVTTINTVNGRGQPTQITDPNSVVANMVYDVLGRVTSITINPGSSQAVTAFEYNAVADVTKITEPNGGYLQYTYNNARHVTEVTNNLGEKIDYTYNLAGSVTETDVKTSGGTLVATQSKTYDELNRIRQLLGASSQTTAFTHDKVDNTTSVTDPRSKLYSYAFDALNRVTQETDPNSYQTNSAYNGKDETTSVTDARSLQTSYVRDGFGDIIRATSPDTGNTDFWYNAIGHVTKSVDARSIETDYTYDNLGRMLTKTFPAASSENVTYAYDSTTGGNEGIGHLTSISDASGSTSYTYNALGQATLERHVIQGITYDTAYTYDASGNVTQITYPSGRIVTYTRDSTGRITGITTKENSGASAVTVVSSGAYNPFGPLTGLVFGNSVGLTIGYDQDKQLTSIQSSVGATTIQNLGYGYDNAGNITSITDNYQSARSQTLGYDNLNRLNSASGAYGSLSFTYDGVGNRATRVVGSTTETYNYSSTANRLSTISVSGSTTRSFSYANSGQVSEDVRGGSTTYDFTYNNNGRIASAALNSSTVGTYLYNGLEQRVAKTASSTTTHYVIDADGHVMSEDDASGNPIREYIWFESMPVALVDHTGMSPVIYFIQTDHLNRPQKLTDGSAALVWDAVYQPFGEPYSVSGPATNLLMFPGQFYDSETVLAQNWHREYDATLGRYIQSDPIGLGGGINRYAYVGGNPFSKIDSRGLAANPIAELIAVLSKVFGDCNGAAHNRELSQQVAYPGEHYDTNNPNYHHYELDHIICVQSVSCTTELVFQGLLRNAAPGQTGVAYTGNEVNVMFAGLSAGTIVQVVDQATLTVTNFTESGHIFDPGYVARSVVVEKGFVMVRTIGEGTGADPWFNKEIAGPAFTHQDLLVKQYVQTGGPGL